MKRKFRSVIHIPENNEWEEQELLSGAEWDTFKEAKAEGQRSLHRYPIGSSAYVESKPVEEWSRHE